MRAHVQYIQTPVADEDRKLFFVKPEEDIYAPILKAVKERRLRCALFTDTEVAENNIQQGFNIDMAGDAAQ